MENTRKHEEQGKVVMVTEHRVLDSGNRKGHIVIRVSSLTFYQKVFFFSFLKKTNHAVDWNKVQ